ncbi:type IV secretory pathway, VirB10 component [Caulobacter sp. AP07]|uniref:TrbI/VirB10 family protein n=1 Tax=Caulobacter sp. AP07 TaxID=1144304 RepID=UPI000271FC41|nr:TrbI/VirB10 family protein [Caulobacter sp. AP07]EJL35441.1 type IV secretory pathway, VirB10 component [Caulobacter sp. AP07]
MSPAGRDDLSGEPQAPAPAKASPRSVLDAPRRPIARYRPAVILSGVLGVLLLVGIGFLIAFGGGRKAANPPAEPQTSPEAATTAPIDQRLPATYGDLPPPKPSPFAPAAPVPGGPSPDGQAPGASAGPPGPVARQRAEEREAARRAGPFFGGATAPGPQAPAPAQAGFPLEAAAPSVTPGDGGRPKEAFIARAGAAGPTYAPSLPQPALSPYEVKAGTVIPAALITSLNSDLPGLAVAQVTEPVFDHRTGRVVLIPQGARLIGKYDSQVGHGQDRVLLVWTRLIYSSGRSVDLAGMTGADATGTAGLSDKVDTHLPVLARAIGLSTLISIGAAAAQNSQARGSDNLVLQDGAGGVAAQASQTGQRLVERDLQRPPTLRIRPGFPIRVMVDKDLILPPQVEADR